MNVINAGLSGLTALCVAAWGTHHRVEQPARTIRVVANDYAFVAPDSATAGVATFTLENRGTKVHEMFIGVLRPGAAAAQITAAHQRGINFRDLSTVYLDGNMSVALFAWPGERSPARASLNLITGRSYILLCQLRDSTGQPQHAALGMFRVLHVK